MKISYTDDFYEALGEIEDFIADDSSARARTFHKELIKAINSLTFMPYKCRKSKLFDDENVRDLIFKGYIIPFEITENEIKILYIFKHNMPKIKDEK